MSWFDTLSGRRRPEEGVPARPPDEVLAALWAAGATSELTVRDGRPERADLVAECEWVRPFRWLLLVPGRKVHRYRVQLRLDHDARQVRTLTEHRIVGRITPLDIPIAATTTRIAHGAGVSAQWVWSDGRFHRETVSWGAGGMEQPLIDAVTGAGWIWRPVLGRL